MRWVKMKWTIADLNQIIILFVKEQRVDGSFCIKFFLLQIRCTLKDYESSYQIRILSNLNQKNWYMVQS